MKNRVYFIGFPITFALKQSAKYYHMFFDNYPIKEYMLCLAQAIFYFKKAGPLPKLNFSGKLIEVDAQLFEKIKNEPLAFLDKLVGRNRIVNPRQFELIKGSVVRSRVTPILGAGVVLNLEKDNILVKFPQAKNYFGREKINCHKSTLRVVSHIKEIIEDE